VYDKMDGLPRGAEATAAEQYRSIVVGLALSLVSLRPCGGCDYQAGDHHSLAPRGISDVLALVVTQPGWPTEALG
jgi:hypothetical protein